MEKITQKDIVELKVKVANLADEVDEKVAAIGIKFLANKGTEEPPLDLNDLTDELRHLDFRLEASLNYIRSLCDFTAKEKEK